jgi:glycosyltransferase involved in cell wall biosynthesis
MGGVVEYAETIRKYLPKDVSADHFVVGGGASVDNRNGIVGKIRGIFKTFVDSFGLSHQLICKRYDMIMINPSFNYNSLLRDGLYIIVSKLLSVNLVYVQFHGWDTATSNKVKHSTVQKWLFRRIFGSADEIAVLSNTIKANILDLGIAPDKVVVSKVFFNGALLSECQSKGAESFQFLFLSRFVNAKGIRNLLDAFIQLMDKRSDIVLVLAGDGPEMGWVKQTVSRLVDNSKIVLPGYVTDKTKADFLCASHVYVLPSESEGCPVSMLEAMAAGCAVLVTPVGRIPEVITTGVNGVIIKDGSVENILRGMESLIASFEDLRDIFTINKTVAWEQYSAELVVPQFADRVRRLICAKKNDIL